MKNILLATLLFLSTQAQAAEVSWVKLPDTVYLGSRDLVLNGAGVRSKFFLDLYIAALYLTEKKSSAEAVLTDEGEKRVALHLLRDISADHLFSAFNKALTANHTPSELDALDASIKQFSAIFLAMKEVMKGDAITLDYQASRGTQVSVNGVLKGTIAGAAFNTALLKIWLGDKPAQDHLKLKLLGR